jgi:hypothetical protein
MEDTKNLHWQLLSDVIIRENGKDRIVAKNLPRWDAREISESLNALGFSSCYTSWSDIC